MKKLHDFTDLYPIIKVIRMALLPTANTLIHINENGIISEDEHRASSYNEIKKIMDEFHKFFIEKALSDIKFKGKDDVDLLHLYLELYKIKNRTEKENKEFTKAEAEMRKLISARLKKDDLYKILFKKELLDALIEFVGDDSEKIAIINEFKGFATYFAGFYKNRENMYVADEKSTAISFRIINDNLPTFIDNISILDKVKETTIANSVPELMDNLKDCVGTQSLDEIFSIDNYPLTIKQSQIDTYNTIIGGRTVEDTNLKVKGLNEYINLYNQQPTDSKSKIPHLKPLKKQILSDRVAISWLPEKFNSDNEVISEINNYFQLINDSVLNPTNDNNPSLKDLLHDLANYNLDEIYLTNDNSLCTISKRLYDDPLKINRALEAFYVKNFPKKFKKTDEQYLNDMKKYIKSYDSFSISFLNECMQLIEMAEPKNIQEYFTSLGAIDSEHTQKENLFMQIANCYTECRLLLNQEYPDTLNLSQDESSIALIYKLLTSIKDLQHFIKPLFGSNKESSKDELFYCNFSIFWETLSTINKLFDKVRNYVTKKPYSEEKIKLNFQNSSFLNGWDKPYSTKSGFLVEKGGLYYLIINNQTLKKDEIDYLHSDFGGHEAKMIALDFQKPDFKTIPKNFIRSKGENYSPAVAKYNLPIDDIIDIYDQGKYKTEYRKQLIDNNQSLDDYYKSLHALIDYFKLGLSKHESYKHFNFHWQPTEEYLDISEFYHDAETSCYMINLKSINWDHIIEYDKQGKLYVFQIYNKDFSKYSKGTPNLHTLYFKALFSQENLKNIIYKLNGQSEIFYRKSSIKDGNKIVHPALCEIENKNVDNPKKTSTFDYDIIKDRRYTVDKFQLHLSISMNFQSKSIMNINPIVNESIKLNSNIHIIGIDRGERNLIYLSLIDGTGKIIDQISFNETRNEYNGNHYTTNYHALLDKREKEREQARENWKTIENIKELKEGFLSQVIYKISQWMVKYNAIVVLEDLNSGFMRGRQKVEKQVYEKFEKKLIEKLNYLVDKRTDPNEPGGLYRAYQLTNKADSITDKLSQNGFVFYIPAWNTSKIDPTTGFVNLFDTRYENKDKARAFFCKFDSIRYNHEKDWFEFATDNYSAFNAKANETRQDWIICTHGKRIETFRNSKKNSQWDNREIDLTQEFKTLFSEYYIDINSNLKEAIANQDVKEFFERILHLFKLTLQMRNSITGTDVDYLVSPVADKDGNFYDSRTCGNSLPLDADANGAYNIARKGLMIVNRIKATIGPEKVDMSISNRDWLRYAQSLD